MHHKLIYPTSGAFFVPAESAGIVTTPQNVGFDPEHVLSRLRSAAPHTFEALDAEALAPEERSSLYGDAVIAAGNRYAIRQVFGSRKNSGMHDFGTDIPALLVYDDGRPVEVFPHPAASSFATIRGYVDGL